MEFYLRWLPVHRRIKFKIALITYKTLTFWHLLKFPYRPWRSFTLSPIIHEWMQSVYRL